MKLVKGILELVRLREGNGVPTKFRNISGVDVMIAIFGEKIGVFLKNQFM
jgi:hypothetical protein